MCTCEDRLQALGRFDQVWIDGLKRQIQFLEFQEAHIARALISGSELTILDKPVRVQITWPEGRPYGLSDKELLKMIPVRELPPGYSSVPAG